MEMEGRAPGYGVRVVEDGGRLIVTSEELAMGWTARTGRVPGTAVRWGGWFWEVVERGGGSRVERWVLEPWPDGAAMRRVVSLDVDSLRNLAVQHRREEDLRRRSVWLTLASPVLGFAPAGIQRRLEAEHGYPAMLGMLLSGLLEIVLGAIAVVVLATGGFSGVMLVPRWAAWLMAPAPLLLLEGMVRLHHANAHGEPVGSILGAPLLLFSARSEAPASAGSAAPGGGAGAWILGNTLRSVVACFAPREFQERWARRENVAPWVPTVAGAGFELLGGVVDILHDGGVTSLWSLLSLALVVEGTVRLVLLARSGRPVGSLLGLPFRSFYRRLIPPDDGSA